MATRALGDRARAPAQLAGPALATLRALSPTATLERGYAVARPPDGTIVRDPTDVAPGEPLEVVVARGTVDTRVERTRADGTEELLS